MKMKLQEGRWNTLKCQYEEWKHIAQGDEGLWGKECFCQKDGDICPGYEYCKKYMNLKEGNK